MNRRILAGIGLLVGLSVTFTACGGQATPIAKSSPSAAASTAASPADASGVLPAIIDGAKKEGTVSVALMPAFGIEAQDRLVKEIKSTYDVDLKFQFTPANSFNTLTSQTMAEHKSGVATFDVMVNSSGMLQTMIQGGVVSKVDWGPILRPGTPAEVVWDNGASLCIYTEHTGLLVNTSKVPADRVPKTWRDLADPQWTGKFGIQNNGGEWVTLAYLFGKDKALDDLRVVMKNKPIVGERANLLDRFLIGEIILSSGTGTYAEQAIKKGVQTAFYSIQYSSLTNRRLVVPVYAKHPNAAKLVASYLAGPEGQKLLLEMTDSDSMYYPGGIESGIQQRDQQAALPMDDELKKAEFTLSTGVDTEAKNIIMGK